MSEEALERYRQRYETWRHLDRLRYLIVEVTLGALVATVAVIEVFKSGLPIWSWLAVAIFLLFPLGAVFTFCHISYTCKALLPVYHNVSHQML